MKRKKGTSRSHMGSVRAANPNRPVTIGAASGASAAIRASRMLMPFSGEIGRTPSINNRAGRDHYVRCWSTALAGCGIQGGQAYGASDENGVEVKNDPVTEGDFFATIYQALSIKPTTENYAGLRPVPLAPFGSAAVEKLLK